MLIDVRTEEEFNDASVEGAINLPLQDIQSQSKKIVEFLTHTPKDTVLQVHCASGGRSAIACILLKQFGFTNVENIGGFEDACACYEENKVQK